MSGVASRLRQRVTLERRVAVADSFGGQEVSWEPWATVFAAVEALRASGRERSVGDQARAEARYRVTLRALEGLDASMRVRWGNRVLQIHAIQAAGALLELVAYEEQL